MLLANRRGMTEVVQQPEFGGQDRSVTTVLVHLYGERVLAETDARRYSDEELALIVQRASELQDQAGDLGAVAHLERPAVPSPATGLTLQAVREIADEVGLEPRFVEEAAASLAHDSERTGLSIVLGGPTQHQLRSTFRRRFAESERAELLDAVRRYAGHDGEIREVLGSVEWRSMGLVTGTTLAIDEGDDKIVIRVRADASGLAAFTWIGSIVAGLVAGGVAVGAVQPGSILGVAAIVGSGGAVGVGLARSLWSRAARRVQDRARRLQDEVGRFLSR